MKATATKEATQASTKPSKTSEIATEISTVIGTGAELVSIVGGVIIRINREGSNPEIESSLLSLMAGESTKTFAKSSGGEFSETRIAVQPEADLFPEGVPRGPQGSIGMVHSSI